MTNSGAVRGCAELPMIADDKTMPEEWTAEHEMALPEHLQRPQSGTMQPVSPDNELAVATLNSRRSELSTAILMWWRHTLVDCAGRSEKSSRINRRAARGLAAPLLPRD